MKGIGYLISTLSVLLLGAVAWPKAGDPSWKTYAVAAGMTASILGMALRFLAHRKQDAEVAAAKARPGVEDSR